MIVHGPDIRRVVEVLPVYVLAAEIDTCALDCCGLWAVCAIQLRIRCDGRCRHGVRGGCAKTGKAVAGFSRPRQRIYLDCRERAVRRREDIVADNVGCVVSATNEVCASLGTIDESIVVNIR